MTAPGDVVAELRKRGIVAVVRASAPNRAAAAARALADGGVTAIEVTFTVPDAARAIAELARDERLLVGAGTVERTDQARAAVAAGARFLVSPYLSEAAIEVARETGIPAIPGVFTPTEVAAAARTCELLKLFPASLGGVEQLNALRGPFPDVAFMPSGGVTADNLDAWFAAGAVAVGAGGDLAPAAAVEAGDAEELRRRARSWSAALAHSPARMSQVQSSMTDAR